MGQLSGDISLMPLPDLVIWLANRRLTGVLQVELGTIRKEFVLVDGAVIRASSTEPREYLGQFLIHGGLVTDTELRTAVETQYETNVRLGRILVMIGAVTEEMVVQLLKVKITETLLESFRWTSGRFVFVDHRPNDRTPEIEVSVPLVNVHREGIARAGVWEQYDRIFPNALFVLYVDESRVPADLQPHSIEDRIIRLARQNISIEALALELHATDYQVAARLYDLHQAGAIYAREPSYELPAPGPSELSAGQTYADLARAAMDSDAYGEALRQVDRGARENPGDPAFSMLRQEVESKAREKMGVTVKRTSVPSLTRELHPTEKKRLSSKERYVLARIDGQRTIDAIIQLSPMHDIEALEILKKFERDGLITL